MSEKFNFPTPHFDKLNALLNNEKLPERDLPRIEAAIERYNSWKTELDSIQDGNSNPDDTLARLVESLNQYKLYIDLDLVFDSEADFLYRQKGQLKIDNTVIEEFLPRIVHPSILPEMRDLELIVGPTNTFSAVYFSSSIDSPQRGGGMGIRTKDQDFAISKKLYIKASHNADFSDNVVQDTNVAYIVAECKTNLDKTMFQEACATASDVRRAVSGAKYFLLCEWLDMTPLSTAPTDIEEVLILRKAKRISSNIRSSFSSSRGRQASRETFKDFLGQHPLELEMFTRFREHIRKLLSNEAPLERDVLKMGYF